jgi:hypothetical protein
VLLTIFISPHIQCVAESIRGKKDWINGSLGGIAAGAMLGLRGENSHAFIINFLDFFIHIPDILTILPIHVP